MMMMNTVKPMVGRVILKLGDDISTDVIYPGRYMATVLPNETPQYAFADDIEFNSRLKRGQVLPGSIVVAGSNFGCGSSREQAASALKGYDLVIIARGFGRIFLQNAINLGLKMVICPAIEANLDDEIEITADQVLNKTSGKNFPVIALPKARQAIIDAGGLIPFARKLVLEAKGKR